MRNKTIGLFTILSPMVNDLGNADLWAYLALAALAITGLLAMAYWPV